MGEADLRITVASSLERDEIVNRYARRAGESVARLYEFLNPAEYMSSQERERALIRWIKRCNIQPLSERRVLEIGCGTGKTLAQLIRLGFEPQNLVGTDLLADCVQVARSRLPAAIDLRVGDASELVFPDESFDIVVQSTVF